MTTDELLSKLSKKYPSPQYAFLSQVRNQTGYGSENHKIRTADALALGLWKSRGYHLHGFELKISRSDWMHELKDPSKAEAIAEYCDMFSLVISDIKIIDISEVPKTWGIMVAQNGTVKTIREAPMLQPKMMDRDFLCGFMRNVTEGIQGRYTPTVEVDKIIKERVESQVEWRVEKAVKDAGELEKLRQRLKDFEVASGIPFSDLIYQWGSENKGKNIGEAVKAIMSGDNKIEFLVDSFERLIDESKRITEKAKESLENLKDLKIENVKKTK